MILFLVRHGKAERDAPTGRDEDRPLNERGERQSLWLGESISRMPAIERPSIILTSPASRALNTARIIQGVLSVDLRTDEALGLGAPIGDCMGLIVRAVESDTPVMLVGHNPTMEHLVATFTGNQQLSMRTGEAALLEVPDPASLDRRCRLIAQMRFPD